MTLTAAVLGQDEKSRVQLIAIGNDPLDDLAFFPLPLTYLPPGVFFENSAGEVAGVSLTLGKLSERVEVPGGELKLPMRLQKSASIEPWFEVTLPATGDYLLVLSKPQGAVNAGWEKVQSEVVDLGDDRDLPEGSIRFVNASKRKLMMKVGGEKVFMVKAGSVAVRERPPEETKLTIGFQDGDGSRRMAFQNSLPQAQEGERLSYFVFDDEEKVAIKIVKEEPAKVGP